MWGMVPNLAAPPVDEGPSAPCDDVDPVTGAVCSRSTHHADHPHHFEDQDWKITWPPHVELATP